MSVLIDEVSKTMDGLFARIRHPFFGAFTISFLIWNWEIPYLILRSDMRSGQLISLVQNNYLYLGNLTTTLGWPLLVTIVILAFGPIISEFFEWYQTYVAAVRAKWEPVPKQHLDMKQRELDEKSKEATLFQEAFHAVSVERWPQELRKHSSQHPQLLQSFRNYQQISLEIQGVRSENTILKAENEKLRQLLKESK